MTTAKPARSLGITFRREGSFIKLSGYMDEFSDYSPLLAEATPLKLKLSDVLSVNSLGIRKWIAFIRDYGMKQVEFHECSPAFIEAANMMPGVISTSGKLQRIKSVQAPFSCTPCRITVRVLISTRQIQERQGVVTPPTEVCPRCGEPLTMDDDPADLFFFCTYGLPR